MALAFIMPLLTLALVLAWWRKWLPARAWSIAVVLQLLLVASGVASLRSGEAEEERVEQIVEESFIEAHEEAAEAFVWTSAGVLVLMAIACGFASRPFGLPLAALASVGAFVVFGLGYRTGKLGGELVYKHGAASAYEEFDPSAPVAPASNKSKSESGSHSDYDDD